MKRYCLRVDKGKTAMAWVWGTAALNASFAMFATRFKTGKIDAVLCPTRMPPPKRLYVYLRKGRRWIRSGTTTKIAPGLPAMTPLPSIVGR